MIYSFRAALLGSGTLVALLLMGRPSPASERRFAFTQESAVLPAGDAEIEPWTTFGVGREHHYARIEQRLELELGLTHSLQTALYWNFAGMAATVEDDEGALTRVSEVEKSSVSSEWKYKLSDPLADALGSALYLEATLGPEEAALEAKIILDKQVGSFLFALNLVGENEWELGLGETETEQELEVDLAAGVFLTPTLVVGLEAMSSTLVEEEVESSRIYLGPSLAYASSRYWLTLSALPQVLAPKGPEGETVDLEHGERLLLRALVGFHL